MPEFMNIIKRLITKIKANIVIIFVGYFLLKLMFELIDKPGVIMAFTSSKLFGGLTSCSKTLSKIRGISPKQISRERKALTSASSAPQKSAGYPLPFLLASLAK